MKKLKSLEGRIIKVLKSDIKRGDVTETMCPIALAAKRSFKIKQIYVDCDFIQFGRNNLYKLPSKAIKFIRDFDCGYQVKPCKITIGKPYELQSN